jgi:hypothetical protein
MSDFSERIRNARLERPTDPSAPHPELEAVRPRLVEADADPVPEAEPAESPSVEELEEQRRRIDALARKIDDLNATILQEILRQPGGADQYPRTVAALADELSERVADSH